MTENADHQLIKFADGELTSEEEANVLLDCERSPEQWKDLALSLVTQRRLQDALTSWESDQSFPNGEAVSEKESSTADTSSSASLTRRTTEWQSALRICGMSLALVLAFLIGRQQTVSTTGTSNEQSMAGTVNSGPQAAAVNRGGADRGTAETLRNEWDGNHVVETPNEDSVRRTLLPRNPWHMVSKPVFSAEDQKVFHDAGLDIKEENTIYILTDAQGGRWAIPWKAINVRIPSGQ